SVKVCLTWGRAGRLQRGLTAGAPLREPGPDALSCKLLVS
ncbi:MAG: hypothetical protein JWQ33_232, partial [Ramlibacter sp.]|nr:hypothetical protein [Ramlibacter sp.]